MRIGVIGGGLMGMTLAHRLTGGHAVTVFERDPQLGGLATYHDYGGLLLGSLLSRHPAVRRHLIAY